MTTSLEPSAIVVDSGDSSSTTGGSVSATALVQTPSASPALHTSYGHGCRDTYGHEQVNKRYKAQGETVLTCETRYMQGYKHTLLFDDRETA